MALFEPKVLFFGPGSHLDVPIGFSVQAVPKIDDKELASQRVY